MQVAIPPVDPKSSQETAELTAGLRKQMGHVPNFLLTMAHSPALLSGYLDLTAALRTGCLPGGVREQIALTVAGINDCDYCASAHTAMARAAGVSAEEASLNLQGKASDGRVQQLLDFAGEVVRNRGHLAEQTLGRLREQGFSNRELVETLGHVGLNIFNNYFNHVAGTVNDFPPVAASGEGVDTDR